MPDRSPPTTGLPAADPDPGQDSRLDAFLTRCVLAVLLGGGGLLIGFNVAWEWEAYNVRESCRTAPVNPGAAADAAVDLAGALGGFIGCCAGLLAARLCPVASGSKASQPPG